MIERFLVTDLTRMQGNRVCVGGLLPSLVCVRPFPGGDHPTESWLLRHRPRPVRPFSILEVTLHQPRPNLIAPHTEDREIGRAYVHTGELPEPRRRRMLERLATPDLRGLFGATIQRDHPEGGGWVRHGAGERSLATLAVAEILDLTTREPEAPTGLRLGFRDGAGNIARLPVTDLSCRMYADWLVTQPGMTTARALGQINTALRQASTVYLRLGLARGWERYPERCYLQVNGIYTFPDYLAGRCYADFIPAPVPVDVPF